MNTVFIYIYIFINLTAYPLNNDYAKTSDKIGMGVTDQEDNFTYPDLNRQ